MSTIPKTMTKQAAQELGLYDLMFPIRPGSYVVRSNHVSKLAVFHGSLWKERTAGFDQVMDLVIQEPMVEDTLAPPAVCTAPIMVEPTLEERVQSFLVEESQLQTEIQDLVSAVQKVVDVAKGEGMIPVPVPAPIIPSAPAFPGLDEDGSLGPHLTQI